MKKFRKIINWFIGHKIFGAIIIVAVLVLGYFTYKKFLAPAPPTTYILTKVEKGSIQESVSGTGEVSATNQIELKPKVSGTVTKIYVKAGQAVGKGTVLAVLDATDALKVLRDAKLNLENAKLALSKLQSSSIQSADQAVISLDKAYDQGFNSVVSSFLNLPNTLSQLDDILNNGNNSLSNNALISIGNHARDYRNKAITSYYVAKKAYDRNKGDFQQTNRDSENQKIDNLIEETYETNQDVLQTLKDSYDLITYVEDQYINNNNPTPAEIIAAKTSVNSFINTTNSAIADLQSAKSEIQSANDEKANADLNKTSSQSALDIKTAELTVEGRQNALADAESNLSDYTIRAPFAGVIGNVPISTALNVTVGTTIASLVTNQKIAIIAMNEVDVSKIKVGQYASLTFDAVPDLTLAGTVEEIEGVGTEDQGVVTYNVKIALDTQDVRIKPNMSTTASIITDSKDNVLKVPNSAIKSNRTLGKYVEELPNVTGDTRTVSTREKPKLVPVKVGLSNDSDTEIVSGLSEGEVVVARSISTTTSSQTSSAPSLFGGGGGGGGGRAGASPVRIPR